MSSPRLFINIIIDVQPGWVSRTDKALKGKGFKTRLTPPSTISGLKAYGAGNPGEVVRELEELLSTTSWRALCIEHWLLVKKQCPCPGGRACVEPRSGQLLHAYCREDGGVSYRVLNAKTPPPSNPLNTPRSMFKICGEPAGLQDLTVKLLNILKTLTSIE